MSTARAEARGSANDAVCTRTTARTAGRDVVVVFAVVVTVVADFPVDEAGPDDAAVVLEHAVSAANAAITPSGARRMVPVLMTTPRAGRPGG